MLTLSFLFLSNSSILLAKVLFICIPSLSMIQDKHTVRVFLPYLSQPTQTLPSLTLQEMRKNVEYQTLKDSWEESCVLQGVSAKEWVITSTVKRPFSGTCSTRQPGPSTNQKPSLNNSVKKILTSVLRFSQTVMGNFKPMKSEFY